MTRESSLSLAAVCLLTVPVWAQWTPAGPWGGSATSVAIDQTNPQRMLLGARNSLIYMSEDAGENWRRLNFPRHFLGTVRALAFDQTNPQILLAGVNGEQSGFGGVWRSMDGGGTWALPESIAGASVEAMSQWAGDQKLWVAGTHQGVWLSHDGGSNWTRISQPWNHEMRVITAVAFDPDNREVIYAGTPHLPWKTTDGGKTWNSIHEGMLDDSDVFSIFVDPERPQRLLASACSGIYRSESGGGKWAKFAGIPASHRRTHVIRPHPRKANVIYAGTTLGLMRSTDGGGTFRQLNRLHILSMVFHPADPEILYMATEEAGLWRSDDGGVTARAVNRGFVNRKVLNVVQAGGASGRGRLYLNTIQDGEAGGVFTSSDGGAHWTLAANASGVGDNHLHHLAGHPNDPGILYAANQRSLYRSTDGGKSWKSLPLPMQIQSSGLAVSALSVLPRPGAPGDVQILLGTLNGLYRGGATGSPWTLVGVTKADKAPRVLSVTAAGTRIVVRTSSALYLSDDTGLSWRPLSLLLPTSIVYDIAVPADPSDPILLATAKGLVSSSDQGRKWSLVTGGLDDGTVSAVQYQPNRRGSVWLVRFGQLYESHDFGRSWRTHPGGEIVETSIRALFTGGAGAGGLIAITPDIGVFSLKHLEQTGLR
ncbi:MAG TPA: YCF48-related protein [Bryobacteraceae bacterium]|nr:YCF48-related protein [Bryobacteraceae bacterium]